MQTLREISPPALDTIPETPEEWLRWLGGPVWFRLPGRDRSRCRAWMTLAHGNEPSGTLALHRALREGMQPAVDLICCVASVHAALAEPSWSHRFLPGGRDLNRCFRAPYAGLEGALAEELLQVLAAARPEALVDVHNTSGTGPAYGVADHASAAILRINGCFCERLVLSEIRLHTLVEAASGLFPALTIECGGAHDVAAHMVAFRGLREYACREQLLETSVPDPQIFAHPVRVELKPDARVVYADAKVAGVDLTLLLELDRKNFGIIERGEMLGWLGPRGLDALQLRGASSVGPAHPLFEDAAGVLLAACSIRPLMITTNPGIAISDCLFYAVTEA